MLILSCFELFISDIVIKDCFYLHYISFLKGTYSVYSQNFKICYSFISQFHKSAQFATSLFHNFKRNRALYFTISRTNRALIRATDNQRICVFTQLKSANTQLKLNSSVLKSIGNRHLRTRISVYAYRISKLSLCRVFDCVLLLYQCKYYATPIFF